jgi:hypothetical protein
MQTAFPVVFVFGGSQRGIAGGFDEQIAPPAAFRSRRPAEE